jgi:hypothetical protein
MAVVLLVREGMQSGCWLPAAKATATFQIRQMLRAFVWRHDIDLRIRRDQDGRYLAEGTGRRCGTSREREKHGEG